MIEKNEHRDVEVRNFQNFKENFELFLKSFARLNTCLLQILVVVQRRFAFE